MGATYNSDNPYALDAFSQVTVVVNAPPTGGDVEVAPWTGYAFNTTYFVQASGWMDDAADLPLTYVLSYYALNPRAATVIKNADITNYVRTRLGQGLQTLKYNVTIVVAVTDSYNCSGNATTAVNVLPPISLAALANATSARCIIHIPHSHPHQPDPGTDLTIQILRWLTLFKSYGRSHAYTILPLHPHHLPSVVLSVLICSHSTQSFAPLPCRPCL